MTVLATKNTAKNTMYSVQESHTFYNNLMELYLAKFYSKSHYKAFHFHKYFHDTLQVIHELSFFCIYSFYNLSILLCHMSYNIHTHIY